MLRSTRVLAAVGVGREAAGALLGGGGGGDGDGGPGLLRVQYGLVMALSWAGLYCTVTLQCRGRGRGRGRGCGWLAGWLAAVDERGGEASDSLSI